MTIEELEAEALKLNPNFRARLAEKLLHSLEGVSDAEIERFWVEEAQRRDEEWDAGETSSKPAEEVLRDARSQVR
jgi:hypothetical protein